jgi:hypothetical protein
MHLYKRSCTSRRTCEVLTDYAITACHAKLPPADMTRDRAAVTCAACRAEAPCLHCNGEGRILWEGASGPAWFDCLDCAGTGEAAMDPFDPIHHATALAGARAYAAAAAREASGPIRRTCESCGTRWGFEHHSTCRERGDDHE